MAVPPRVTGAIGVMVAVAIALVATLLGVGGGVSGSDGRAHQGTTVELPEAVDPTAALDPASGLRYVDTGDLPAQAVATLTLIDRGGPYPYDEDGSTFENREGILPAEGSGYYEEFTVPTPGSGDRGAWRIVAGAEGELFWTADHYDSFERIRR